MTVRFLAALIALGALASSNAVIYDEIEPNDSYETGNVVNPILAGDRIRGHVHGRFEGFRDRDNWNLHVPNESIPGIYEYSLRYNLDAQALESRQDHIVRTWDSREPNLSSGIILRGSTDDLNPTKFRFYSFGINGHLQYNIRDTIDNFSGSDYDLIWDRSLVTPMDLGTYGPGQFRFDGTRRPTSSDTTLVVLNSAGRKVSGGAFFASGEQIFSLNLTLAPGTYYTMLSNNITSDEVYVLPWVVRDSQFKVGTSDAHNNPLGPYAISLTAGGNTRAIEYEADLASKGASGISFGKITVVPEPGSVVAFLIGASSLYVRRRKKN